MKEIKTFPNRKWVIKAGIGFLIIMGLLTFFSNTIMNYSLPQVTTVTSSGGSMTTAIKGTGTVIAKNLEKMTAPAARKVDQVNFGVNEDVKEGDVIATLSEATDTEKEDLKTAQDALKALQNQKLTDDLQAPVYDYTVQLRAISDAQKALDKANAVYTAAQSKPNAILTAQTAVTSAQTPVDAANDALMTIEAIKDTKLQAVTDATAALSTATDALTAATNANPPVQADIDTATTVKNSAQTALDAANAALTSARANVTNQNLTIAALTVTLTTAQTNLAAANALPTIDDAALAVADAQQNLNDADKALSDQKKADGISQQIAALSAADKVKALTDAQKKVDDLTAFISQTSIVATKAGRISSINLVSGTEMVKGDVVVTIDVVEDGFIVPISFTTAQAAQMTVGMGARLDNYGGSDNDATVVSIKPDSTDPRNKKTVTFLLNDPNNNYWFSSGSSVSLTLNNRSKDYQCIIPLSAVHEESGETFVYAIKEKQSPLGVRYIAVKVTVKILAKDDTNAAIDPSSLGAYGSRVITESNDKSFASGDQVRLAEGI